MRTKRKILCGIYKITSPTNKVYIGQSIDIEKRWWNYKSLCCQYQIRLYRSFLKYGIEKHKFEVISECEESKLNELEKYYVDLFQTFNSKYGLNLKDGGGSHGKTSEETKKKIGDKNRGRIPSQNTINNLIKARKVCKQMFEEGYRRVPWNKGQKTPKNVRERQSISAINRGGHKSLMKGISMFDLNGNHIKDFESSCDAGLFLGNKHLQANILKCCNGERNKCHNYIWKYKIVISLTNN